MNELITISKYWQEWKDPRLIIMVLNNRDLGTTNIVGWPEFEASQNIPDVTFARFRKTSGFEVCSG